MYDISFAENFYSWEDDAVAVVFHELSHVKHVGENDPEMMFLRTRQDADDEA